jgi:hypothetical protein
MNTKFVYRIKFIRNEEKKSQPECVYILIIENKNILYEKYNKKLIKFKNSNFIDYFSFNCDLKTYLRKNNNNGSIFRKKFIDA